MCHCVCAKSINVRLVSACACVCVWILTISVVLCSVCNSLDLPVCVPVCTNVQLKLTDLSVV